MRILPLRDFYRCKQMYDDAVKNKITKKLPNKVVQLVHEIDALRIETEAREKEEERRRWQARST